MRDVDPDGMMSLTEYDIASARAANECPACAEHRYHTEAEWCLHPGEGRQGVNDPYRISKEPAKVEVKG